MVSTAFYLGKEKLRHSLGRPSRSDFVQSVFAATGAINGYAITGSSHITRTTASASTTYEKRTGSISVDSTYSYVNTYTLATGSSTKSKGYYTSVEINFSAPYNCHSVRIRSSHKVSAYGQTWSSNSTAVY